MLTSPVRCAFGRIAFCTVVTFALIPTISANAQYNEIENAEKALSDAQRKAKSEEVKLDLIRALELVRDAEGHRLRGEDVEARIAVDAALEIIRRLLGRIAGEPAEVVRNAEKGGADLLKALERMKYYRHSPAAADSLAGITEVGVRAAGGVMNTYFPVSPRSGETVTGYVYLNPNGNTETDKRTNIDSLTGYVFEVNNDTIPIRNNAIRWLVPLLPFTWALISPDGQRVTEGSITPVPGKLEDSDVLSEFVVPPHAQGGDPIAIIGRFGGATDSSQVFFDTIPGELLCVTNSMAFVRAPTDAGTKSLLVREGNRDFVSEIDIYVVHMALSRESMERGSKSRLEVTVSGPDKLDDSLELTLENRSPEVISLRGGDQQTLTISPDDWNPVSGFTVELDVDARQVGAYTVVADLAFLDPCPYRMCNKRCRYEYRNGVCTDWVQKWKTIKIARVPVPIPYSYWEKTCMYDVTAVGRHICSCYRSFWSAQTGGMWCKGPETTEQKNNLGKKAKVYTVLIRIGKIEPAAADEPKLNFDEDFWTEKECIFQENPLKCE